MPCPWMKCGAGGRRSRTSRSSDLFRFDDIAILRNDKLIREMTVICNFVIILGGLCFNFGTILEILVSLGNCFSLKKGAPGRRFPKGNYPSESQKSQTSQTLNLHKICINYSRWPNPACRLVRQLMTCPWMKCGAGGRRS